MKISLIAVFVVMVAASCANPEVIVVQGTPGPQGEQGPAGQDGKDGMDGVDGKDAVVETIQLCPDIAPANNQFTEYLVRINGSLYGVYASGQKIGLTKLFPGSWMTTDGRNCHFTIDVDSNVSYY